MTWGGRVVAFLLRGRADGSPQPSDYRRGPSACPHMGVERSSHCKVTPPGLPLAHWACQPQAPARVKGRRGKPFALMHTARHQGGACRNSGTGTQSSCNLLCCCDTCWPALCCPPAPPQQVARGWYCSSLHSRCLGTRSTRRVTELLTTASIFCLCLGMS